MVTQNKAKQARSRPSESAFIRVHRWFFSGPSAWRRLTVSLACIARSLGGESYLRRVSGECPARVRCVSGQGTASWEKPEVRRPKSEVRKKAEGRSPKWKNGKAQSYFAGCEQLPLLQCREPKEKQADGQTGATTWRVKTIPFLRSLPCDLCSVVRPNRSVSRGFPMQTRKADRIMAGQNHAERKTGGAVLNDSVRS
jgi:hypothetical protein